MIIAYTVGLYYLKAVRCRWRLIPFARIGHKCYFVYKHFSLLKYFLFLGICQKWSKRVRKIIYNQITQNTLTQVKFQSSPFVIYCTQSNSHHSQNHWQWNASLAMKCLSLPYQYYVQNSCEWERLCLCCLMCVKLCLN